MLKDYSIVKTYSSQTLKTGETAPDFKLRDVEDKAYSLHDFTSKLLLVVFICNHCPYVKARIGDIIDLQSKFKTSELQVVGINSNDPDYVEEGFDNMIKFAKQQRLNFPYLIDDTQDIAKSY